MDTRQQLLDWVEQHRQDIIDFFQAFVRARSPNPPGDTTAAAAHIRQFLDGHGLDYRVIDPQPTMANIVASFDGGAPGRHLVLNGHIDVFPVGADPQAEGWTKDPWGGEIVDGKLYGRGACDMKAGTSASIWTYLLLNRIRQDLKGKLTLTCVSDEETFGPWGARYLMEHHPEVHGDCCLNGEPSSPLSVRFGEKGPLWLKFTIRTPGAHGAYTHASESATRTAMRLIHDLETLEDLEPDVPSNVRRALTEAQDVADQAMGAGAAEILPKITLNIGTISGGLKNNMIPGECSFEADIRLPVGVPKEFVMDAVEEIAGRYPASGLGGNQLQPPLLLRPLRRDDGHHPEHRRRIARRAAEAGREPRRHGCPPVALSRHPGLRLRPLPARHGLDGRTCRHRRLPAHRAHPRALGARLSDGGVIGRTAHTFYPSFRTERVSAQIRNPVTIARRNLAPAGGTGFPPSRE